MLRLSTPSFNRLLAETPVASDFESRQLFLFEQAVDGRRMYAQVLSDVAERQDQRRIVSWIESLHTSSPSRIRNLLHIVHWLATDSALSNGSDEFRT
jgi:hypothetical protein